MHSTEAPFPEYKTQSIKKSRLILPHYGVFKGIWDWVILVATFYVALMVPYNAAFAKADRQTKVSDVIVEALFIVGKWIDCMDSMEGIEKYLFHARIKVHVILLI